MPAAFVLAPAITIRVGVSPAPVVGMKCEMDAGGISVGLVRMPAIARVVADDGRNRPDCHRASQSDRVSNTGDRSERHATFPRHGSRSPGTARAKRGNPALVLSRAEAVTCFRSSDVGARLYRNKVRQPDVVAGARKTQNGRNTMNGLIYLVGLVVVVLFILSLLGLR